MKAKQNNMNLKNSFTQIKRIFKYARPYRVYLYLSLICYLASSVLLALVPLYIGEAIDYIIGINNVNFTVLLQYGHKKSNSVLVPLLHLYPSSGFFSSSAISG